jgi:hypothetical protein
VPAGVQLIHVLLTFYCRCCGLGRRGRMRASTHTHTHTHTQTDTIFWISFANEKVPSSLSNSGLSKGLKGMSLPRSSHGGHPRFLDWPTSMSHSTELGQSFASLPMHQEFHSIDNSVGSTPRSTHRCAPQTALCIRNSRSISHSSA